MSMIGKLFVDLRGPILVALEVMQLPKRSILTSYLNLMNSHAHVFIPMFTSKGMVKKVDPRLRELAPGARGSNDAGSHNLGHTL